MTLEEAHDIVAAVLAGTTPAPTFRQFLQASAAVLESDWPQGAAASPDWPAERHRALLSRGPEGAFKCPREGRRRVTATNDAWRDEIIRDAVSLALSRMDAVLMERLRMRFDAELVEATALFRLRDTDEALLEAAYLASRTATVTARLLEEAGLAEQVQSYATRLYFLRYLLVTRRHWLPLYLEDLEAYDELLRRFDEAARPDPSQVGPVVWDPPVTNDDGAGEYRTVNYAAYVSIGGRRVDIYTGSTVAGNAANMPGSRPDHPALAEAARLRTIDGLLAAYRVGIGGDVDRLRAVIATARGRASA